MTDILNFIYTHCPQYSKLDEEFLTKNIVSHVRNNTFDIIRTCDEIKALTRYNIINDGRVCNCLDLVIKPNEPSRKIMKYFVANMWLRFPSVMFVRFERGIKYPERQPIMYEVKRFL